MSLTSTEKTVLDGYKTKPKRLETELRNVRELLAEANAENRSMDTQLDGLGDDARRRYEAALARSEADPGRREHAAVVRSTREAVDSYKTITGRKP